MIRTPTHYTTIEGGSWLQWNAIRFGAIQTSAFSKALEAAQQNKYKARVCLTTYGGTDAVAAIAIHALKFEGGAVWDCINGWRP